MNQLKMAKRSFAQFEPEQEQVNGSSFDSIHSSSSPETSPQSAVSKDDNHASDATERPTKRSKFERCLQQTAEHDEAQDVCAFLQMEYGVLCADQGHVNAVASALQREVESHTGKFATTKRQWQMQAKERLDLVESYQILESAVDAASLPAVLINQGTESTSALLGMISAFAGVPSAVETDDCINLWRLASSR